MRVFSEEPESDSPWNQLLIPDLWQQDAAVALREGKDVVVTAPTGAGKTLIFELWSNQGKNSGQAVYTVPTRALANDKLAEWRARGWNVGIATGDLAENLDAPIIVATLETQKSRLIRGEGPTLLVVDEYQMIGDPDRGLNYELSLALAPPHTQLLLLSGSVDNPRTVVKWLQRLGRNVELIEHKERPVPLEEAHEQSLNAYVPSIVKGYWPRLIVKALSEDLGPILIFAPRRRTAESMALELSRYLPNQDPLALSESQRKLTGDHLSKLLKSRIAYHHSGLSYGARAGVIEPLAKAGQLRVVVATMGLAAGINFSLRTVAIAAESYRRGFMETALRPDEILQMFGRAGRRGLDEIGYVLVSANGIGIRDAFPGKVTRADAVDWSALLRVMDAASEQGKDPFEEASRVQERLFTTKAIPLGVENSINAPNKPCGLSTDAERARHVRRPVRQFRNSRGEWEDMGRERERPASEVYAIDYADGPEGSKSHPILAPFLTRPEAVSKMRLWGGGRVCVIDNSGSMPVYGKEYVLGVDIIGGRVTIVKWVRKLLALRKKQITLSLWEQRFAERFMLEASRRKLEVVRLVKKKDKILAQISVASIKIRAGVDRYGVALWGVDQKEEIPEECLHCDQLKICQKASRAPGVALLWKELGLINTEGTPTRRGKIAGFFSQGAGLAIAAALEDLSYDIRDLVYDLANLDAGFRFCGDEYRWEGRLALSCRRAYGDHTISGYLESGAPPRYGFGAEQVVAAVHQNPANKNQWISKSLGTGDIDRIIIEWRSLLRQIGYSPDLEWDRWKELKQVAGEVLNEVPSPTLKDLPPLEFHQTQRINHRLTINRRRY